MTDTEALETLQARVAKGLEWLNAYDPVGNFHRWFEAGIFPSSPVITLHHTEEERDRYREYYRQRELWERLWKQMDQLEARVARSSAAASSHPETAAPPQTGSNSSSPDVTQTSMALS